MDMKTKNTKIGKSKRIVELNTMILNAVLNNTIKMFMLQQELPKKI